MSAKNYNDEIIKDLYSSLFIEKNHEISYLILICSKIMMCDSVNRKIVVDVERLFDEFVYMKYYTTQKSRYLLAFFIPLMLANRSMDNYIDELISLSDKLTKFYNCKSEKNRYILEVFILDLIFRKLLNYNKNHTNYIDKNNTKNHKNNVNIENNKYNIQENIELINFIKYIKNCLVEFTPIIENKKDSVLFQVEKLKFLDYLYETISKIENNYYENTIDENMEELSFEIGSKAGLNIIDLYIMIYLKSVNNTYNNIDVFNNKENNVGIYYNNINNILTYDYVPILSFLKLLLNKELNMNNLNHNQITYETFTNLMSNHIIRIKNFDVKVKKYSGKSNPKYLLTKEINDVFYDPILNNIKIKSKVYTDKKCMITVDSKSGEYTFIFEGR